MPTAGMAIGLFVCLFVCMVCFVLVVLRRPQGLIEPWKFSHEVKCRLGTEQEPSSTHARTRASMLKHTCLDTHVQTRACGVEVHAALCTSRLAHTRQRGMCSVPHLRSGAVSPVPVQMWAG